VVALGVKRLFGVATKQREVIRHSSDRIASSKTSPEAELTQSVSRSISSVRGSIGAFRGLDESGLMSTGLVERPILNAWQPMQLQLVVFPTLVIGLRQQEWWREVVGQEPEESRRTPQARTDNGTLADSSLSLTLDPSKITWTMAPRLDPDNPLLMMPTLAPFPESRDRFIELLTPWLRDTCPPIKRIGIAGSLLQEVESHADAYRLLNRYLPDVGIDPESSDFLYRVNRKRRSNTAIPDLQINRITVWSALKTASVIQTLNIGSATQPAPTNMGEPRFAAMLNLDVNSDAEREAELPRANRLELLGELTELATEIATFGDVR
jgi:hypothetical protein